jgi:uncharacterized protein with GYD domain
MPRFLIRADYTAEGLQLLRKEGPSVRRRHIVAAVESLGGRVEAMHWALGEHDIVLVCDLPGNANVAALDLQASLSTLVQTQSVALLDDQDAASVLASRLDPGRGQGASDATA